MTAAGSRVCLCACQCRRFPPRSWCAHYAPRSSSGPARPNRNPRRGARAGTGARKVRGPVLNRISSSTNTGRGGFGFFLPFTGRALSGAVLCAAEGWAAAEAAAGAPGGRQRGRERCSLRPQLAGVTLAMVRERLPCGGHDYAALQALRVFGCSAVRAGAARCLIDNGLPLR